jgi:hypothetical protein
MSTGSFVDTYYIATESCSCSSNEGYISAFVREVPKVELKMQEEISANNIKVFRKRTRSKDER